MSRKYFIFMRSKKTFDIAKKFLNLNYVWNEALGGAGWTTTIELSHPELTNLKVKLWNCKYTLLSDKK